MNRLDTVSEYTTHAQESVDLHQTLRALSGSRGVELSDFIANTAVHATGVANSSAMESVLETTKTIMTLFNRPNGASSIGFWKNGRLPKFMVVLDVFGKRGGFHSENPTLVRELCSSFYGPVDCGFGNGSTMRREIDNLARQADVAGNSLLLVLSAPWGSAIGDRFWRLCSVRTYQDAQLSYYIDSDVVFCSMQRPPATSGSSVLGNRFEWKVSNASVNYIRKEWHAIDTNVVTTDETGMTPTTEGNPDDKRMLKVMANLVKTLKARDKEQQQRIDELETGHSHELNRCIQEALQKEREIWTKDVEIVNEEMGRHAKEFNIERVRVDALRAELREIDDVEAPLIRNHHNASEHQLAELRGKLLVLDEELKRYKSTLGDARKRDNEVRRERAHHDAIVESKGIEIASLQTELQSMHEKLETTKHTAAEQVAQLLDKNVDAGKYIEMLKVNTTDINQALHNLRSDHAIAESAHDALKAKTEDLTKAVQKLRSDNAIAESATLAHASALKRATVCLQWARARRATQHANKAPDDCGTTRRETTSQSTTCSEPPTGEASVELPRIDLLNAVAATKALVAQLNSFVERVQTEPTQTTTNPPLPQHEYSGIQYDNYYENSNMIYPFVHASDTAPLQPRFTHHHPHFYGNSQHYDSQRLFYTSYRPRTK